MEIYNPHVEYSSCDTANKKNKTVGFQTDTQSYDFAPGLHYETTASCFILSPINRSETGATEMVPRVKGFALQPDN